MSLFERIKHRNYLKAISANIAAAGKDSRGLAVTLATAKKVGIYFPAEDVDYRKTVLRYAEDLRKQGKQVTLLGYIPVLSHEATFEFAHFTDKDIDWAYRIKADSAKHFIAESFDLLIALTPQTSRALEFVMASAKAKMRIGPVPQFTPTYELMLDMPAGASPLQFIKQFEQVLDKTNKPALVA